MITVKEKRHDIETKLWVGSSGKLLLTRQDWNQGPKLEVFEILNIKNNKFMLKRIK